MTEPFPDLVQQAEKSLREGNLQQARLQLVEFLKSNPGSPRAWWVLSFAVPSADQQIDCLERVLRLDPAHSSARQRLAKLKDPGGLPPLKPAVKPFAEGEEPAAPAPHVPPVQPASRPASPFNGLGRGAGPNPPAAGTQTGRGPALPPRPSPGPGTPRPPSARAAPAPQPKRKSSRGWLIADLVMVVLVLAASAFLAGYFWLTGRQSTEARALQQTQVVAQELTGMPLPTLPATWTPTEAPTALPTGTPTATATLAFTRTATLMPTTLAGPMVTLRAPEFSLMNARTGEFVSLSQFAGQPVLLFFWATWCHYCEQEMNDMEALHRKYKDRGFVLLAINDGDSRAAINSFRSARGLSFPMLVDADQAVSTLYGVNGIPQHFFIGTNGKISSIGIGTISADELDWQVQLLLRYPAPTSTP